MLLEFGSKGLAEPKLGGLTINQMAVRWMIS